jgi:hypothetical protein
MSEPQGNQHAAGERVVYERCLCREALDHLRDYLGVSPAVQEHLKRLYRPQRMHSPLLTNIAKPRSRERPSTETTWTRSRHVGYLAGRWAGNGVVGDRSASGIQQHHTSRSQHRAHRESISADLGHNFRVARYLGKIEVSTLTWLSTAVSSNLLVLGIDRASSWIL